jgi:hypothetical protein
MLCLSSNSSIFEVIFMNHLNSATMKNKNKIILLACLFMFFAGNIAAQQTGNIVEIFGKDKVETTHEGIIVFEPEEGLALRNGLIPGRLTGMQEILFWQLATGRFEKPQEGMVLPDNYKYNQTPLKWEKIKIDSAKLFTGNMGRAYLYTEFDSPEERIALLEATGHTRVYINGLPQEGDHYDYGYTLIPFLLKKGLNQFIYTYGRFGRVRTKIVIPHKDLQFSPRDMTLPSVLTGDKSEKWGAVRLVNASAQHCKGLKITCRLETGETASYVTDDLIPLSVRKIKFKIPALNKTTNKEKISANLTLLDHSGKEIDRMTISLNVRNPRKHHERTFISSIDGSVQYFSVAPSTSAIPSQAFVLSVHGASVEATNQARAYKQKDWAHIIAPTNRRPFGFNWEEWGRIDALEVLHEGRKTYHTDSSRTYLTGHSMGGHGTWFLGATYPDKWAAIAPAAGYPDIIGYRRADSDSIFRQNPHFDMIYRGALPGRVISLANNYLQSGVYILHGDADMVVPVQQARQMREILGKFHNNLVYYEYPEGSHWYGDHSMDWPPLFDFFKQNKIPKTKEVRKIEFTTASPAVSASNYWLTVLQQISPYQLSKIKAEKKGDSILFETENIKSLALRLTELDFKALPIIIGNQQQIVIHTPGNITLDFKGGNWCIKNGPNPKEKNPERYGGFKLAFTNRVVFVYATGGTDEENAWYLNKARFDAETFLYRGNSSVDIIPDTEFSPEKYAERNIIIYGNANNNKVWNVLLNDCPVQVYNGKLKFGSKIWEGHDLGTYFIYPRPDSNMASIGIVAGTGPAGMKALYPNDYFSGITGFPDLLIFGIDWIKDGIEGLKVSGFFGNDWSIETGDFKVLD